MFGLRLTTEAHARAKNGRPAQSTTGAAQASCSQFDAVRLSGSAPGPAIISVIARPKTGLPMAAAVQNRRVMSASSGSGGSSTSTVRGSSAIPQAGQVPGASRNTSGCIGQMYSTRRAGVAAVSGSSAIPQLGHGTGPVSRTSGHIGQTYVAAAVPAPGTWARAAPGTWAVPAPGGWAGAAGTGAVAGAGSSRARRNASGSLRKAAWHPPQQNRYVTPACSCVNRAFAGSTVIPHTGSRGSTTGGCGG